MLKKSIKRFRTLYNRRIKFIATFKYFPIFIVSTVVLSVANFSCRTNPFIFPSLASDYDISQPYFSTSSFHPISKSQSTCTAQIFVLVDYIEVVGRYQRSLSHNGSFYRTFQALQNSDYQSNNVCLNLIFWRTGPRVVDRHILSEQLSLWKHGKISCQVSIYSDELDIIVNMWQADLDESKPTILIDSRFPLVGNRNWFSRVKALHERYKNCPHVFGISTKQSVEFDELKVSRQPLSVPTILWQGGVKDGTLVLGRYEFWKQFTRWLESERSNWFLWPIVQNPSNRHDSRWHQFNGTIVAPWTMWLSRFMSLYDVYTLYSSENAADENMIPKSDCAQLVKMNINGTIKQDLSFSRVPKETVKSIVDYSTAFNMRVSITFVNEAFLETARSWMCNTNTGGFRPPGLTWIAIDEVSYNALREDRSSRVVRFSSIDDRKDGLLFGRAGYWRLMLERVHLIRDLLYAGVSVLLFETDQVWLRNPIFTVEKMIGSGTGVELVATLDAGRQLAGNFLYFRPSLQMRKVYEKVCLVFEEEYKRKKVDSWGPANHSLIDNDQSILSNLVLYNNEFRHKFPITLRILDQEMFACGRWYRNGTAPYNTVRSRSPTLINNNWIQGTTAKKLRLMKHGHWFLTNGSCNSTLVKIAISENERRHNWNGYDLSSNGPEGEDLDALKRLNYSALIE